VARLSKQNAEQEAIVTEKEALGIVARATAAAIAKRPAKE
jgi:hypothetical protein